MASSGIIIVRLTTHNHCMSACAQTSYRCCAIYIVAARCVLIFPDGLAGLKSSWMAIRTALNLSGPFRVHLDGFKTVLRLTIGP